MPDNCNANDCIMAHRVEVLEEANRQHSKTHGDMFDRLRKLETENAVQNAHYKAIEEKLDELKLMVTELTAKPGKRWDSMVDKALLVIVGAVVGYALFRLGLSA